MRRAPPAMLASMVLAVSLPAAAEPRTPTRPAPAVTPSSEEERAFEADARRYQRLQEFTEKLVREREQREFEQAVERYQRLSELTRRLTERAEAAAERELDAQVALYLRKAELTRRLAARDAPSLEAGSTSAPNW